MKKMAVSLLFIFVVFAIVQTMPVQAATPAQIAAAVSDGVKWLGAQQSKIDGSWPDAIYADDVATTGLAVLKLEDRAFQLGYTSPFDPSYEYSGNVTAGLNYLFTKMLTIGMTLQDHRSGATGTVDNPDSNADGLGVYAHSPATEDVYDTGIVLSAISVSDTPSRVVSVASPVNGWSYSRVAQDMVDWLAWAQSDFPSSNYGEGGWIYTAMVNMSFADNSNSGYAALGLGYALNFGCTVPQWVKTELDAWITYIQDTSGGTFDGGSWYTKSGDTVGVNILKTGNLIFEMELVGDSPTSPRVVRALNYLARHWADASGSEQPPGWDGTPAAYQTMFTAMKGLEYMGINTFSSIDWYADFSDKIVTQQDKVPGPDYGSWQTSADWGNGSSTIITAWALLTLEKAAPKPQPLPLPVPVPIGGFTVPVVSVSVPVAGLASLTVYISLVSIFLVATVATAIYTKRVRRGKEKQ